MLDHSFAEREHRTLSLFHLQVRNNKKLFKHRKLKAQHCRALLIILITLVVPSDVTAFAVYFVKLDRPSPILKIN